MNKTLEQLIKDLIEEWTICRPNNMSHSFKMIMGELENELNTVRCVTCGEPSDMVIDLQPSCSWCFKSNNGV